MRRASTITIMVAALILVPVFFAGANDCEPNDTLATAVLLSPFPCLKVAGELPVGDTDYFRVEPVTAGLIWISTITDGDTVISLHGADGAVIESDDDDGESLGSLIAGAELDAAGTYYVRVYEYGFNNEISYDLYVTFFPWPAMVEEKIGPNETYGQAQEIGLNRWVSGTFTTATDADWYKFTATFPGDLLVFQLDDDPGRTGTGHFDSVLELYGQDGVTLLADSDHEGTGPDEPEDLIYENTTVGRRFLCARSDTGASSFAAGPYYLAAARAEEHVCPTATPTPSPLPLTPTPTPYVIPTASPVPTAPLPPSPSPTQIPYRVIILETGFKPPILRVDPGRAVAWWNEGTGIHTTTANLGSWDSGPMLPKDRYIVDFTGFTEQLYNYRCVISGLTGKIIYGPATPPPPPTAPPAATPTIAPTAPPASTPASPWVFDYDGDGDSDIAIFRGSSGLWAVRGVTRTYFGTSSDTILPGDYNGDGSADIAVFRDSSGLWAVRGLTRAYFGSSGDEPLPGDYDGDGNWDIAVFRESSGLWAVRSLTRIYFGSSGDEPVPGFYSGEAGAGVAIFRPSSGLWVVRSLTRIYFGSSTDTLVPGDYDGDGSWEAAVFRPSSGLWAVRGTTRAYFGTGTDRPIPLVNEAGGGDEIAIFRESSGLWAIQGVTRAYFGASGDLPATR